MPWFDCLQCVRFRSTNNVTRELDLSHQALQEIPNIFQNLELEVLNFDSNRVRNFGNSRSETTP
jgi:hypothetical protein